MLKTQYIVGAVALLTGTALGFMDIFLFDGKTESSGKAGKSTAFSQTATRFMEKETKKELSQIMPSLSNMSVLIPHYAGMSAAELKAEIKRLGELPQEGKSAAVAVDVAIRYLLRRLGLDFPGEVAYYIDNEMDKNVKRYADVLLNEWAQNDFDGAMEYFLANLPKFNFSTDIFESMVRKLIVNDFDKAMEWGFAQKGKIRQKALSQMVNALADNQREKIVDFVGRLLPEDLKKGEMLADISEKWGSCDWESAMRWADTLSNNLRKEAIVGILGRLSSTDLKKATEEFKKQSQELQGDIAKVIVDNLKYKDYDATNKNSGRKQAISWIMENAPAGEDTDKLTRNLFGNSSALTPELIDHVKKLPDGSIRDNALLSMAKMTAYMAAEFRQFTYEDAFALTEQIKDDKTKKKSILNYVNNWISDDPESAHVWIEEKSGFTGEEKQRQLEACEESLKQKKDKPQEKGRLSKWGTISIYED